MNPFKLLFLALDHAIRLPLAAGLRHRLRVWASESPEKMARASRFMPFSGAVLAMLIALAYAPSALWLPQSISVVLALSFGLWASGARHEAGWARYCGRLGLGVTGSPGRDGQLPQAPGAMGPSRSDDSLPMGAAGVVAMIMMMAMRIETLAALDPTWVGVTLLAAHVWSRVCLVWVWFSLPAALSSAQVGRPGALDVLVAVTLGLALLALAVWLASSARPFVAGGLLALVGSLIVRRSMKYRFGGHGADGLSAVQQVAEVLFYIGIVAALGAENVEVTVDPAS